jgi:hypothetical protein
VGRVVVSILRLRLRLRLLVWMRRRMAREMVGKWAFGLRQDT